MILNKPILELPRKNDKLRKVYEESKKIFIERHGRENLIDGEYIPPSCQKKN